MGERRSDPWPAAVVCGVAGGVVVATNPWDVPVVVSTLLLLLLVAGRDRTAGSGRLLVAGVVGIATSAPFLVELAAWLKVGVAGGGVRLNSAGFAPAGAVIKHFGQFVVPLAVGAVWVRRTRWFPAAIAVVAGSAAGWAVGSPAAVVALSGVGLFAVTALSMVSRRARLPWYLAALGLSLVAVCERVTLIDRMNTLFKIYNGIWLLLGFALVAVLVGGRGGFRRSVALAWLPLGVVAALNLPLGIAQGWLQPRVVSPRPTLDGRAFLEGHDPSTAWLVETLAACADPGETVAEAAGPPYREYTRISMHTGLPTVVGWEWHLRQRGQPVDEIAARRRDLQTVYAGSDPTARRAALDRRGVRWVAVGDVERATYGVTGRDPLSGVPGVARLASKGSDVVYVVSQNEGER